MSKKISLRVKRPTRTFSGKKVYYTNIGFEFSNIFLPQFHRKLRAVMLTPLAFLILCDLTMFIEVVFVNITLRDNFFRTVYGHSKPF